MMHSFVTSKNVKYFRLIWANVYMTFNKCLHSSFTANKHVQFKTQENDFNFAAIILWILSSRNLNSSLM